MWTITATCTTLNFLSWVQMRVGVDITILYCDEHQEQEKIIERELQVEVSVVHEVSASSPLGASRF